MFFAVKLGHFIINDFSINNKTLKLNSKNRKTKKKSFIGSACTAGPQISNFSDEKKTNHEGHLN